VGKYETDLDHLRGIMFRLNKGHRKKIHTQPIQLLGLASGSVLFCIPEFYHADIMRGIYSRNRVVNNERGFGHHF